MGPILRGHTRRLALILLAAALVFGAGALLAATAGADTFTPEAGPTKNAVDIDTLYKILLFTGLAVIALVWGVLFYSLFRFRARRGRRVPQITGNRVLELGWTIGAGVIVVALAIVTYIMLDGITEPPTSGSAAIAEARGLNATIDQLPPPPRSKSLEITVSGQQYIWRYQYPNGAVSFQQMVVPRDTTVILNVKANDVVHSWWIPALGGKVDAVPGYTNKTWFKATANGTFEGRCAEFCGSGHAVMTGKVVVVDPATYTAWVANQKRLITQAQKLDLVMKKKFQSQGS
jgi:cytochrome c oxidase subunit II